MLNKNSIKWFKTIFIGLMLSLFMTSCVQDDVVITEQQEEPVFQLEKITEFTSSQHPKLALALSEAKAQLSTSFLKSTYDSLNNIWIDENAINKVTSGNYESYTYAVQDSKDSISVKNLVVHKISDSVYLPVLFTYRMDDLKTTFLEVSYRVLDTTIKLKSSQISEVGVPPCISQNECGCFEILRNDRETGERVSPYIHFTPPCVGGGSGYNQGNVFDVPVNSNNPPPNGDDVNTNPPNGDDDSNDNNNPNNGVPSGLGSDNNIGSDSPGIPPPNNNDEFLTAPCQNQIFFSNGACGGVVTSPIVLIPFPFPVDDETQAFFDSLPQDLKEYINDSDQDELRDDTNEFLVDENYSNEAEQFAEEAIKAKEEDEDTEIDFQNKSIYDASVPDCLKDIIDKFKPSNNFQMDMNGVSPSLQQQLNIASHTLSLFDNTGNYGITFAVSNILVNAQTTPTIVNVNGTEVLKINIEFSTEYLERATDLAIARSTVHELVHAYLFYIKQTNPQSVLGQKLDEIIDDVTAISTQHQIMSDQFAGAIASAIEAWDNSNHQHVEYDYLSWSGDMMTSMDFLLLDQNFIEDVYERAYAEEGVLSLNPTIQNILPIGDKNCN